MQFFENLGRLRLWGGLDYYPFGMIMPGRVYRNTAFRFGFNNQEKDNEIEGAGNALTFKHRVYDSRLGRFLSVDPLAPEYPYLTTYQFADNSPIYQIEIEGLEGRAFNKCWTGQRSIIRELGAWWVHIVATSGSSAVHRQKPVEIPPPTTAPLNRSADDLPGMELMKPGLLQSDPISNDMHKEPVTTHSGKTSSSIDTKTIDVTTLPFVAGSPEYSDTRSASAIISGVAAKRGNDTKRTTVGAPVVSSDAGTTTTSQQSITISTRNVITINMFTEREKGASVGGGTSIETVLKGRMEEIKESLIKDGVPANDIHSGGINYGVPLDKMGGNPNMVQFQIQKTTTKSTDTKTTTESK